MKIYFPLIVYPVPSEDAPVCDFVMQGFIKREDAEDLYPDAEILVQEFPESNPIHN